MAFGIGSAIKKTVKKTGHAISKGWKEIDDYAVPILAGAALGAATGGLGGWALAGALGTSAGSAAGVGAAGVGLLGSLQGAQTATGMVAQAKAEEEAKASARRQELIANSAVTTSASPVGTVSQAEASAASAAGANKRRFRADKTTRSSSLGLSRYASNTSGRTTLG